MSNKHVDMHTFKFPYDTYIFCCIEEPFFSRLSIGDCLLGSECLKRVVHVIMLQIDAAMAKHSFALSSS